MGWRQHLKTWALAEMFAKPEREKFCRIRLPIGDFAMASSCSCGILYTNAMITNKILVGDCFLPLMFSIMCEILSPITFKLLCSRGIWSQCQSVKSKKPPHILAFSRPSSLDLPPCQWVITILIERIDRTNNDSQETDVKSSRSKFRKPSSSSPA